MPRTKETRNPFGSILPKKITLGGKKVTVYDARKRYKDADGKPAEKFKRCYSATEAQTALQNFPAEIAKEIAEARENKEKEKVLTFFGLADYYEKEYLKEAIFDGDRQIDGYRSKLAPIRTYIKTYKDFFGDVPVAEISYQDVRRFAKKLATTPRDPEKPNVLPKLATVNRKLGYLRHMLNVGIQLRGGTNPFKMGKSLINESHEVKRDRILTFEEEKKLLAACEGEDTTDYERDGKKIVVKFKNNPRAHLKPMIILAIESGMRKGEILTTKREQVDLDKKIIRLNARQTKALKKRSIPISMRLEQSLREMFDSKKFKDIDFIFGGVKSMTRAFKTACKRAGLEDFRFHDLRHTAATWMSEAGISTSVRMNIIGHSSERIHNIYNNTSDDVLQSMRGKMNEYRQQVEEEQKNAKIV